jgi:hypothetical protein
LTQAVVKAWKEFGGKRKPSIAILDFRQAFNTLESQETLLLADLLQRQGFQAPIVSPDEMEYRDGVLRRGGMAIDVVWRCIHAQEFLMHFDLAHPLVRAYRERRVCLVNSFRTELTRKQALLALLTDEEVTAKFPAAERKAIHDSIPWTRVVAQSRTMRGGKSIDLVEFILHNRERLVLRPNDSGGGAAIFDGAAMERTAWERALLTALRHSYVVQDRVEPHPVEFPIDLYGEIVYRALNVDVAPHAFLGKIQGCTARISAAGGFSSLTGFAPAFVVEPK